ncbi:hypothetical protein ERC79_17075 [Rhodococcus sp. ABRD24]|uniref:hypothetical protein n=1 Tax=Rhodococcus sp. ABRD24 TaxID=2507582 RepID=UPI00103B4F33|nr:hypothetical protein [Rhodococcus sp. ABRD24]QBJ97461.1 hypothetical protein ERC79_17075 [Rhodococcus sp. ABRD24]
MPAPAQAIVAALPTRPTVLTSVAAPPAMVVALPGSPVSRVDGARVPVIPAFVYAAFGGTATPAVTFKPSAKLSAEATGLGSLTFATKPAMRATLSLGSGGSATARAAVGSGGRVVLAAGFGAAVTARTANAVTTATGELSFAIP